MGNKKSREIVLRGRIYDLTQQLIMAIINATDDSFYAASRSDTDDKLRYAVERAVKEGADILDVGGCSTRPYSEPVTEDEEMERVSHTLYIIKEVAGEVPTSVDTYRGSVARMAVREFGCDIVNDVTGFAVDSEMLKAVVELQKPYILTHNPIMVGEKRANGGGKMRGEVQNDTLETRQASSLRRVSEDKLGEEDKFLAEVLQYFASRIDVLRTAGFDNDIIIDPGFGFGKSVEENYALLRNLRLLECFHEPIMVGVSRKSMIYRELGVTAEEALNGTTVLNTVGLMNGGNILRVHDVREAREVRELVKRVYTHY